VCGAPPLGSLNFIKSPVLHLPLSCNEAARTGYPRRPRPLLSLELLNQSSVKYHVVHNEDSAANEGAIRSAVDAFNVGDLDGYVGHFTPSCRRWVAGFDDPLSLTEVGTNMRDLAAAFEPLRLDELLLMGKSDFVCARWQLRGTQVADYLGMPSRGSDIDVSISEIYEISDGKVTEVWTYQDPGQMFRQMALGQPAGENQ
jgi:predicted ester cyclase